MEADTKEDTDRNIGLRGRVHTTYDEENFAVPLINDDNRY